MPTIGYATLQVIPSFKGFAGIMVREATGASSDAARRVEDELTGAGDKAGKSIGQKVGAGLQNVRSAVSGIAGDIVGLGVAFGGIAGAIAGNTNKAKIQAALGISPAEASAAAQTAGTLYAKGWGDSLQEVSDSVVLVKQQLSGLAGGGDVEGLTARAQALSQTFGEDVNGQVRAVATMLRTGLATNATQAFDLIATGFQNGANNSQDLLDTFNEYGVQFKKLGLNGSAALGLITQGLQAGARNSDLVADSLKEFSIRAVDGSTSTSDAYKALGLNVKKTTAQMAAGGPAAEQGLQTVLDKLRGVKDPAKQAQLAVALFGTQAEDLGQALFALNPATAGAAKGMADVDGASKRIADGLAGAVSPTEQFKRSFSDTLSSLAADAMPTLQPILDWLKDAGPEVARAAIAFAGLVALNKGVGVVRDVAGGIRDTASAAKGGVVGVGNFVKGLRGVEAAGGMAKAGGAIRGVASAASSGAKSALTMAANFTKAGAAAAASAVRMAAVKTVQLAIKAATAAWTAVQWLLNAAMSANPITLIVIGIAALVAGIIYAWKNSETFRTVVLAVWEAIKTAVGAAIDFIRGLISTVWGWISAYISFQVNLWKTVITTVWSAISTVISTAVDVVRSIISTVWDWITGYFNLAVTGWKIIISTVWDAIVSLVQWAIDRVRNIITGISAVIGIIRDAFNSAREAAVSKLQTLLDFVGGIPGKVTGLLGGLRDKLVDIGRNIVEGLRDGISGAWHFVTDKVHDLVNLIPKKIRDLLGINSPSRVMRRLFGYAGEGAALGIGDGEGLVARAAARLAGAAMVRPLAAGAVPTGGITRADGAVGRGGINVEHLEVKAYSDRFSLTQVQQDLAMLGVH